MKKENICDYVTEVKGIVTNTQYLCDIKYNHVCKNPKKEECYIRLNHEITYSDYLHRKG